MEVSVVCVACCVIVFCTDFFNPTHCAHTALPTALPTAHTGWFEVVVFKSDGTPMAQHRWRRKSLVSLAPGADKVCSQAMVDELLRQYRETGTVAVEKKKDKRRKEFRAIAKAKGTEPNISSTPFAFSAQVAQMIPNSKQRAMPVPGNNPRFAYRGLPFAASSSSSSPKLCEEMQFWQDLTNFHQRKGLQSEQNAKVANKIRKEKLPKLAHKPLNMYLLFKLVISIGGMQNATANEGKSSVLSCVVVCCRVLSCCSSIAVVVSFKELGVLTK